MREIPKPGAVPTLAEYIEDGYGRHHLPQLEPSTQKTARSQLRKLVARLGTYRLNELTPRTLNDKYVTPRLREVSAVQVGEEINRLARVVNHARAQRVLPRHPFPGFKRPKGHHRDVRIVTPTEERALLRHARPDFGDFIALALDTGLRKGELRVLEFGWINGRAREIRLRQPKTKRVKVIPLTRRAATILASRRRQQPRGTVVLAQPDGRPWSMPWIDRRWREACQAAGVTGVRFNDLRHTFATRALAQMGSPPEVGEILGHKPPYTTTMLYVHPLAEGKRRVIRALERRFRLPLRVPSHRPRTRQA